ncbi:hypothetical protein [Mycobacterium sp. UM_Kg1]|uniref:hypothetical protein n=1 Tax=Mycobacterium sp. UM_Kg1 TaxID=1545691 RepID=UPI00061A9FDE|nr:hypothetical protein [Mycobacterium sp. UM_Kg1]
MNLIVFNNPAELPWQTNLWDLTMLAMFVAAVGYSIAQLRRGRRIYLAVLLAATVYGLVLELAGMATLDMYQQGDFLMMINWPALPLWRGTTMMPAYVLIFYPVFLFTGFKIVEALGIEKRWHAAAAGGLFMIALDAPYVIEGTLDRTVWWTWDPGFELFQYWAGWPLIDLCWQGIWDALFLYLMMWAGPRIDGAGAAARWSPATALGAFPALAAVAVLVAGPVLLAPVTVVTLLGGPQWPLAALLVAGYGAVTLRALRCATPRPEAFTLGLVLAYVVSIGAMVLANVAYEGGLTGYSAVQSVGLITVIGFAALPWLVRRNTAARDRPLAPAGRT